MMRLPQTGVSRRFDSGVVDSGLGAHPTPPSTRSTPPSGCRRPVPPFVGSKRQPRSCNTTSRGSLSVPVGIPDRWLTGVGATPTGPLAPPIERRSHQTGTRPLSKQPRSCGRAVPLGPRVTGPTRHET